MRQAPVVDLVVGSTIFRDSFVTGGRGHVDLPRLRAAGVNVVGLTVATAWPELNGLLSRWHFRSLGLPPSAVGSNMAIAEWLIGRIERWSAEANGAMVILRTAADLDRCLVADGPVGILIGVQGAHVLEGKLCNVARLHSLGVRMLAPAHVMDNAAVGSGTGRLAGGLTGYGREVIAALEQTGICVDLAHMSVRGVQDSLAAVTRPFVLSHTGLTDISRSKSRWQRYSPATRNIPAALAAEVGSAGGLVGLVLSTELLGGSTMDAAVQTFALAIESAGADQVALGSDMDGALKMLIDVEGLPALADALLASGLSDRIVHGVLGANAVRRFGECLAVRPLAL